MPTNDTAEKSIQSTRTAFDIVETIADLGQPTISEIAEAVEHSRSTVYYHIRTLQQERYVIAGEEGYRLGLRMARFGTLSLRSHRLSGVVEKPADDLAAETGETAHVAVKEGGKLVWLYRSPTDRNDDFPTDVGMEAPIHSTAYGQAILAHLPEETVSDIVDDYGLPAVTPHTLTERDALDSRLDTVRELGFAYSPQEYREGFGSIAAPIIDTDDEVVGSIGITTPHDRIDDPYKHTKARRFSDERPGLVRGAARIVNDRLADQ